MNAAVLRRALAALTLAAEALRADRREQRQRLGEQCAEVAQELRELVKPAEVARTHG